jgi:hypothetical protein
MVFFKLFLGSTALKNLLTKRCTWHSVLRYMNVLVMYYSLPCAFVYNCHDSSYSCSCALSFPSLCKQRHIHLLIKYALTLIYTHIVSPISPWIHKMYKKWVIHKKFKFLNTTLSIRLSADSQCSHVAVLFLEQQGLDTHGCVYTGYNLF